MMSGRHSRRLDMNRRFGFAWIWGLATVGIATIVGLIAYHAGQTATVVTSAPGGSEVIYRGYDGFGFFPFFGLFWLLLIGFFVFRLFMWRSWGRGPWGYGGGHYHDHTHGPSPTTPAPTKPEDPNVASV